MAEQHFGTPPPLPSRELAGGSGRRLFDRLDAVPPLSPEERQLLDSVRALARDEIAPRAAGYDRSGEFPWDNVRAINALGLNAMFVPEAYGGAGLSYAAYLACVREISKACASTGIIWATNFHAIKPLDRFRHRGAESSACCRASPRARLARWRSPSPMPARTRPRCERASRPTATTIVVSGGKIFITNGDVADLLLVFGKWAGIADDSKAISALILERGTPGLKVLRKEDKLGHRASSTAALAFEDCRVPRANLLGEPGGGLPLLLAALNKSRPSVAAHALGIARAAFEDAVAYINERRQSGRRIIEFQGIQFLLADLATELAMCEAWLWHVARLVDGGVRGHRDRGLDAETARLRSGDADRHRGGAALRRLRLHQGFPGRAAVARRQDHADLGGHQPDPPPADRPQLDRAGMSGVMQQPLDGIRVLDFTTLLPGPLATLLLAEAGAEVIKIERPGAGDEMRLYQPRFGADSVNFALLNRGKRSIALDLKMPGAIARLRPLIDSADVVVEQFRPGVMERLGLGWDRLSEQNPRLVYCAITGYGQDGPKAQVAAHDLNYLAETGLLSLSAGADGAPVVPPALIADIGGGAYPAVVNILLGLAQRSRTGKGCRIDVSMTDNLFAFAYWAIGSGLAAGAWPRPGGELVTGGSPRYNIYRTADARFLAAAPLEDRFWINFCELIGLEARFRDDDADPSASRAAVAAKIAAASAAVWQARIAGKDVCCAVVATIEEALADPHFIARGLFSRRLGGPGRTLPALPVPIDPSFRGLEIEKPSPALGEANAMLGGE